MSSKMGGEKKVNLIEKFIYHEYKELVVIVATTKLKNE